MPPAACVRGLRKGAHLTSFAFFSVSLSLPPFHFTQFHECWWDSLIIDLLGANVLGMTLGLYTLRFLETRTFDWNSREASHKLPRSLVSVRGVDRIAGKWARGEGARSAK